MEYRHLGRSGLKVSPLCLGTMMFGGPTNEADSAAIIADARDRGFNFIDTADAYNEGESERVVGRTIRAGRDWWVQATKLANPMGPGGADEEIVTPAVSNAWRYHAERPRRLRYGTDLAGTLRQATAGRHPAYCSAQAAYAGCCDGA